MVSLHFLKSLVNCAFCCAESIWHLRIVGFEDGSLVRFFPNVVGSHGDSFLSRRRLNNKRICGISSSRRGVGQPFRLHARYVRQFSQGTVAQRARRKDGKSNKIILLAFRRRKCVYYRSAANTGSGPSNNERPASQEASRGRGSAWGGREREQPRAVNATPERPDARNVTTAMKRVAECARSS